MYVSAGSSEMQIVLPMSALGEPSYVGIYPINMQFVRFGLLSSAQDNLGTHTMRVGRLVAHYNRNNAVEDVAVDGSASSALTIWPNPVDAGGNINLGGVSGVVRADIYSLAGARIFRPVMQRASMRLRSPACTCCVSPEPMALPL